MTENYYTWHSPHTDRPFEMLVFGDRGFPLIFFPTSMGRYYESKDRGLIDAVSWFVDNGLVKIYCVDSADAWSWYNKQAAPYERARNHAAYDQLILQEVLPRAVAETGFNRVAVSGCSFGGYHAANFAFRYPEHVSYLFSLSGVFDMRFRMDHYYDDNLYFHNPVDYLPGNQHPDLWRMGIILGTAEKDITRRHNEELSGILTAKNISHWLDVRPNAVHDWPVWKDMFPHYLSLMK
ncbi:alpha/beta hydrolase-fold protein [Chitinophaga horti]|uniref:Alpha/beta hydrolase-fold protein n=1 Tax=Chitinophaga horti TaxID=2920382 RepID=A0ABY6IUQ1_9BACT|nr:alpha/beta hydrolase-fold protein [Chitinophaga horti]UYQ91099.1 alpha/beta hydrolase-fold protein [Chitinophaga horti]